MKELENKYIELLLKKCINFNKSKSLFINYDKVNKDFITKVIDKANEMGIYDIEIDEEDIYTTHDKLKTESIEEIEKDPYFNKSKWDEYAEKNASFLMIETEFPKMMDDIDSEKVAKAKYIIRSTRELFRKKETSYEIPWCIAAFPNEIWAKDIFKNDPKAYDKLFIEICKICMLDTENPIKSWENYLKEIELKAKKLNELEIKRLHYTNSLGTDLKIEMPENVVWNDASSEIKNGMLVNMPSYEIFSSPSYLKTEGIVYSSRPLVYGGKTIRDFYIKFKDGKAIESDAKEGKEILQKIIDSDSNSCYLGEVALVNNDSPISNTNLVFGTTLFDENASCHLALGDSFPTSIKDGVGLTKEELLEKGLNQSKNHVDFMIGTSDLEIEAETNKGKIQIFKKGNFNI